VKVEKDYEDLLKLLNKHKVRYCIVGAFAVAFYAKPRYTKDIDIFVSPEIGNAKRIMEALSEFGFGRVGLKEEDFSKPGKIIQLGYEPVRIDIVTFIDGCSFEEVWGKREQGIYGKQKVSFIGLNELIKNKKAAMRKQDEVDLDILLEAKKRKTH
jgi:predicted nucleotidyltransferase